MNHTHSHPHDKLTCFMTVGGNRSTRRKPTQARGHIPMLPVFFEWHPQGYIHTKTNLHAHIHPFKLFRFHDFKQRDWAEEGSFSRRSLFSPEDSPEESHKGTLLFWFWFFHVIQFLFQIVNSVYQVMDTRFHLLLLFVNGRDQG